MQAILVGYFLGALCGVNQLDAGNLQRFESSHIAMGTKVVIVLYAPDAATANRAFAEAFSAVTALDKAMSDYDSNSELMRLCRQSPTSAPVPVSPALCEVLSYATEVSRRTDGAFDVTVGPLTKLWRRARRREEIPDPRQLATARKAVGYQHLIVHAAEQTVELRRPDMRIDLGGVAQGYAADRALSVLRQQGISRALVNVSGDIVVSDPPPDKPAWLVGIAPLERDQPLKHLVALKHNAVATSGDAWQFVEIGGTRYSHVLNPHTGMGLTVPTSVSVIAPNGMAADVLSTAVNVLGVPRGLALIESTPATAALIVRVEDGRAVTRQSARFAGFLRAER